MEDKVETSYDKIIRNEIGNSLLRVAPQLLVLDILQAERLPEIHLKLEERILDSVWKVKTTKHEEFILHLEFQTRDHPEMGRACANTTPSFM